MMPAHNIELVDAPDPPQVREAARVWRAVEAARVAERADRDYLDAQEQGFVAAIDGPGAWVSVAVMRDAVIGCVGGFPAADGAAPNTMYLAYIAVDLTYQRTGVGRELLARAEARARAAGWSRMVLTTHESNAAARSFYQTLGWIPTGLTETTPLDAELLVEYERLL